MNEVHNIPLDSEITLTFRKAHMYDDLAKIALESQARDRIDLAEYWIEQGQSLRYVGWQFIYAEFPQIENGKGNFDHVTGKLTIVPKEKNND